MLIIRLCSWVQSAIFEENVGGLSVLLVIIVVLFFIFKIIDCLGVEKPSIYAMKLKRKVMHIDICHISLGGTKQNDKRSMKALNIHTEMGNQRKNFFERWNSSISDQVLMRSCMQRKGSLDRKVSKSKEVKNSPSKKEGEFFYCICNICIILSHVSSWFTHHCSETNGICIQRLTNSCEASMSIKINKPPNHNHEVFQ